MKFVMKSPFKWSMIFTSLFYFFLGLVLLFWPDLSSMALAYCVGAAALLYGIFNILAHFFRKERKCLRLELPVGILSGAFGLFTLFQPKAVLSVLPIALGLLLVLIGIMSLGRVFSLRKLGFSLWWVLLLLTLGVVAVGVMAVCTPFLSFSLLLRIIGMALVYSCISDLWSIRRVSVLSRTLEAQMSTAQDLENAVDVPFEDVDGDSNPPA